MSRYHSVKQAEAAGYSAEGEPCVVSPGAPPPGAMGIHYVNEDLFEDPAINALEPEILLEPQENGKAKLVGIEYMKRSADQTPPIDASDRPSVLGIPFDGPMPEHAPGWAGTTTCTSGSGGTTRTDSSHRSTRPFTAPS